MKPHLVFEHEQTRLWQSDCFGWLAVQPERSIHAVVTDPPYGLHEYTDQQQQKLRAGKGGVWRMPPSFDGIKRAPLPRFSVLSRRELLEISDYFEAWAKALRPVLVPGAHIFLASNPLVSPYVAEALARAGMERRGEVIRLVMTMRGGDRPKGAHDEFSDVTVMPRSQWEPWLLYREPLETKTVADNLRKHKTGALRRVSGQQPFGDVIQSAPTRVQERELAKHPSLKPQAFLRKIVRASLPMGEGVVLDPFSGSGSTLAAAIAVGYDSVGVERDPEYVEIAKKAIPALARYKA